MMTESVRSRLPSAAPKRIPKRSRQSRGSSVLKHLGLIAGSAVMVYPLIWLVVSSFKPNDQIFRDLSIFTTDLTAENYITGWDKLQYPFGVFLLNSTIIAIGSIVGNLVSCSLAAYAFGRLKFRGRNLLFAIMLATIMLPYQVVLVPQFTIFKELGWLNTFLPLIVPKFLATDAFFIFLFVQFIRGIPRELDQAAKIDGAGPVRIFVAIIFPLLRPALVTGAIFTFLWTYNDFFSQLIYISDIGLYTVPLGLRMFLDMSGTSSWGPMLAMGTLSLLPMIVVFVIFQRQIVEGISTTGLKG